MPPKEDASPLEELRSRLYAPNAENSFSVPVLSERPVEKTEGWTPPPVPKKPKKRLPLSVLFVLIAAGFFLIALCVAAYIFFFGARSVSTNNISITVQGPTSIASGDTVPLAIAIENKNPVNITNVALSVDFPDGTRAADDKTTLLARYSDTLDDIPAGQTANRAVSAVLFGSEGQHVSIPIKIEYHVPGSNSVFVKNTTYDFTITTSPLSVTAQGISEVPSGQKFSIKVLVHSNATAPLQNVAVLAAYPSGFVPANASSTGPLFAFGTLSPGEERTFTIAGSMLGQDGDTRVFTFTSGTAQDAAKKTLDVSYASTQTSVTIAKPFLATMLSFDRDSSDSPVIRTGTPVDAVLTWQNALASQLFDGQVAIQLTGDVLDKSSIQATGGFYRSSDNTILFNRDTVNGLSTLNPGDSGNGAFTFATRSGKALITAGVKNPTVTATVSVSGRRIGQGNVPENLSSTVTRTLRVGTDLTLAASATHSTGPFTNTGPWPPSINKETTYTVTFALSNTVNSVGGATVTATLPSYVRFTGSISPTDGSLAYNDATRTVTWSAGDIGTGAGYTAVPKQISFQVALLPSLSQKGTSPVLVSSLSYTGVDRFTQRQLLGSASDITTNITNDPAYKPASGAVTQ